MSGTSGGYELVQILYNSWKSFGIDEVKVAPYDVLMSYPNRTNPNRVSSCIIFHMTPPPKKWNFISIYSVLLNYVIYIFFFTKHVDCCFGLVQVQLLTSSGDLVFQSALFEPALDSLSNNSEIIPPFNAFAAAGISEVMLFVYQLKK